MSERLIILNRNAPIANEGWIHIVPRGELPNKAAGIVQVLDEPAMDSILANIAADKSRLGEKWPGLYAGEEHFIYNDEKSSAAFAWFKDFEKRDDGIWAKADGLTDLGKAAIENKRFKFTSFVADRADTKKLDGNKVRILKLDTVGFTNQANGKELLTPITNREELRRDDLPGQGRSVEAGKTKNTNERKSMKSIATLLALSAEASEEAILAEVTKIKNRAETAEKEVAPLKNRVTELETVNGALMGEQVDGLLAQHGVSDSKVVNRLKPLLLPLKNREERAACLADLGFKPGQNGKGAGEGQRKLFNRDVKAPGGASDANDDEAKSEKIRNRASELQSQRPGRSWDACWNDAIRETASKN